MNKAKDKGGTGRGTGKKGWNRWNAGPTKLRVPNLILAKVLKKSNESKSTSNNKVKVTHPNEISGERVQLGQANSAAFSYTSIGYDN